MFTQIDNFLNSITMYKLVLYVLIGLVSAAVGLSAVHILAFNPINIIVSALILVSVSRIVNWIFSKVYAAPTNIESADISALILALIITPAQTANDYGFLFWAAAWAMATKYLLAIHNKHIFNPAAIAVVITSLVIGQSASWWVGTASLVPFVLIGGILVVRKIRRTDLVYSFIFAALASIFVLGIMNGQNVFTELKTALIDAPLFFFASIMLTEPLTTPPTQTLQVIYGALVGFLFSPQIHVGSFYTTPELALVMGNIFSYLVSPKTKLVLKLKEKFLIGSDIYDFLFPLQKRFAFTPGQYLEWTLPHTHADSRGNRRYFTIASSPTETDLRLGIKFYKPSSSYKKSLLVMEPGGTIVGAQLAGDFTLPKDKNQKLVFIAGGIGITPFRSMLKYLLDTQQKRNIIVLFANKTQEEIVYQDVLKQAELKLGIPTYYFISQPIAALPADSHFVSGRITFDFIQTSIPDFQDRTFYISGPHSLVTAFEQTLNSLGVPQSHLKTDFFPGFT